MAGGAALNGSTTPLPHAAALLQPLNVFVYITVRTVYASLTAMFLALAFGPSLIRRLRELQIGAYYREEGPQEHKEKGRARPHGRRIDCSL